MLLAVLLGCPTAFHGDSDGDVDADTDVDADADTDTGLTIEEDDARVRALTGLPEGQDPAAPPLLVRIDYVVDGDTFYCTPDGTSESLKVRMIGMDTPEIAHDDPAECYGNDAWAYSESQLLDHLAWLTFDQDPDDDYGRSLNYVIRDTTEAGFFNRNLVRNGYALPLTIAPDDTYQAEIQSDADAAEAEGRGLWSACGS
jgi:micrococcal nuclease